MRVVFVTDLHGSTLVFRKALSAANSFEADLLIIGGDLSGKQLLAVVPDGQEGFLISEPYIKIGELSGKDERESLRRVSKADMPLYLRRLEAKGYYWHRATQDEIQELNEDPSRLAALCDEKIFERVKSWSELVNEELLAGAECIWTGGNDDEQSLIERLAKMPLGRFRCGEGAIIKVDGFEVLSLGFSNETPFQTSRELSEHELAARLNDLLGNIKRTENLLLNVHVPPKDCGVLDLVINPRNPREMIHAGSEAVRDFIKTTQPLADFAGHVHEGRGSAMIGRTRVFNPGSEYNAGILQGYVVSLGNARVLDFAHFSR